MPSEFHVIATEKNSSYKFSKKREKKTSIWKLLSIYRRKLNAGQQQKRSASFEACLSF